MKTAAVITLMSTLVVFSALLLGFGLFNEHRQNNETHGTEPDVILRQGAQTGPSSVSIVRGFASRDKVLRVNLLTPDEIKERLTSSL